MGPIYGVLMETKPASCIQLGTLLSKWCGTAQSKLELIFCNRLLYCGYTSAKVDIMSRYPTFFRSLLNSPGKELRVLSRLVSRDIIFTTGENLAIIRKSARLNPWEAKGCILKQQLCQSELVQVPDEDKWRIPYLRKLLILRRQSDDQETQTYIEELIQSLVIE